MAAGGENRTRQVKGHTTALVTFNTDELRFVDNLLLGMYLLHHTGSSEDILSGQASRILSFVVDLECPTTLVLRFIHCCQSLFMVF